MKSSIIKYLFLGLGIALLLSCSNTRHLPQGKSLLIKNKITYNSRKADKLTNTILKNSLRPKPNRKILAIRVRLSLYNAMGKPNKDNFWKFVKDNIGEEPVLYDEQFSNKIQNYIIKKSAENGFFNTQVEIIPKTKRKKTILEYQVNLEEPYTIGTFQFVGDSSILSNQIDTILLESLVKPGDQYRLTNLKKEIERISHAIKDKGYYYFSDKTLFFEADTNQQLVNLLLKFRTKIHQKVKQLSYINDIKINYGYDSKTKYQPTHTENYDSVLIHYYDRDFIPSVYTEQLFINRNSEYKISDHYKTMRYLSSLDVFKFINVVFNPDSVTDSLLNVNLFLAPLPKYNFKSELGFSTKSSGYAGPNLNTSITNRNLFHRAIKLDLAFVMGLEWQMSNKDKLENVINLGLSTKLRFPKLYWPINYKGVNGSILPYTNLELKYNYINYKPFVNSHIINLNLAYFYTNKKNTKFEIRPYNIEYYHNNIIDDEFGKNLDLYPSLRLSLENRFIIGGNYYMVWDSKLKKRLQSTKETYYYKIGADLSGNIIYGFQQILGEYEGAESQFWGLPFSQFARLEADLRRYIHINEKSEFAGRLISNFGLPYKNSKELPYYKQYFIGGANSIQAFLPRTIGPGAFHQETEDAGSFILHSGEINLEADFEYRFNISGRLDGATFLNIGNIWLREKNAERPLAEFDWNRFYNEFAVGSGFGLRVNYDILVIRLDWGIPLRYPYQLDGSNWIFNRENFHYSELWGKSILNFAIGYPF